MPLYEYACPGCGRRFESLVPRWDSSAPPCPGCGVSGARRLLSAFSVAHRESPAPGPCGSGECACRRGLEH